MNATRSRDTVNFSVVTAPKGENDPEKGGAVSIGRIRHGGSDLARARAIGIKRIGHISEIGNNELVSGSITKDVSSMGSDAVMGSIGANLDDPNLTMFGRVGVHSDISISQSSSPSSMIFDTAMDISLWIEPRDVAHRRAQLTLRGDEKLHLNSQGAMAVSSENYGRRELIDGLNLPKREVEDLTQGERDCIQKGLVQSQVAQSRKNRLIFAYVKLLALQTGGGNVRFNMTISPGDVIREQGVETLVAEANRTETAYVYCPDGKDRHFIAFCYSLACELDYIAPFMSRRADGRNLHFRARGLEVPREARRICVVTGTKSAYDLMSGCCIQTLHYNPVTWHGYICAYAKANSLEKYLDEAKALAMALVYHEHLPNVRLEKPVSTAERYHRAAAKTMASHPSPRREITENDVAGGFTVAISAAIVYKNLKSNELTKRYSETYGRDHGMFLTAESTTHDKLCRMIHSCGLSGAGMVLKRLGAFMMWDDPQQKKILEAPFLPMYGSLPETFRDNHNVFANSITETLLTTQWRNGAVRGRGYHAKIAKLDSFMSHTGVINGDNKLAAVYVKERSDYDVDSDKLDRMQEMLREGDVKAVRVSRIMSGGSRRKRQTQRGVVGGRRVVRKEPETSPRAEKLDTKKVDAESHMVGRPMPQRNRRGRVLMSGRSRVETTTGPPVSSVVMGGAGGESPADVESLTSEPGEKRDDVDPALGISGKIPEGVESTDGDEDGAESVNNVRESWDNDDASDSTGSKRNVVSAEELNSNEQGGITASEATILNFMEEEEYIEETYTISEMESRTIRLMCLANRLNKVGLLDGTTSGDCLQQCVDHGTCGLDWVNKVESTRLRELIMDLIEKEDTEEHRVREGEIEEMLRREVEEQRRRLRAEKEQDGGLMETMEGVNWVGEEEVERQLRQGTKSLRGIYQINRIIRNYNVIDHGLCQKRTDFRTKVPSGGILGIFRWSEGTPECGFHCGRCISKFRKMLFRDLGDTRITVEDVLNSELVGRALMVENEHTMRLAFRDLHNYMVIFEKGWIGSCPEIKAEQRHWRVVYKYLRARYRYTRACGGSTFREMTEDQFVRFVNGGQGISSLGRRFDHLDIPRMTRANRELMSELLRLAKQRMLPEMDEYDGDDRDRPG
jgi:hypothetical protein